MAIVAIFALGDPGHQYWCLIKRPASGLLTVKPSLAKKLRVIALETGSRYLLNCLETLFHFGKFWNTLMSLLLTQDFLLPGDPQPLDGARDLSFTLIDLIFIFCCYKHNLR